MKSAVFYFSTLAGKKIQHCFSPRKKPELFKKQGYFSELSTPIFLLNCESQKKKLKSYFGPNWGSHTEIKKHRLFSVKTVYFRRK